MHVYTHKKEYHSLKWMKFCHLQQHGCCCNIPESIMFCEISQTKINTLCYHLYIKSKIYIYIYKIKQKHTHRSRELLMITSGKRDGGKSKIGLRD